MITPLLCAQQVEDFSEWCNSLCNLKLTAVHICRNKLLHIFKGLWEKLWEANTRTTHASYSFLSFFFFFPSLLWAFENRLGVFISWQQQQHTPCCYLCCNRSLFPWQSHFLVVKQYQIQMRLTLQLLLADCSACFAQSQAVRVCCFFWRTS